MNYLISTKCKPVQVNKNGVSKLIGNSNKNSNKNFWFWHLLSEIFESVCSNNLTLQGCIFSFEIIPPPPSSPEKIKFSHVPFLNVFYGFKRITAQTSTKFSAAGGEGGAEPPREFLLKFDPLN